MCTITHFFDKSKFFCLDNIHIGLSCRWSGTKKTRRNECRSQRDKFCSAKRYFDGLSANFTRQGL